jgi:hypothetical protein
MFAGHDHCYEFSQRPGGLSLVTSGGAGAYLYLKSPDAARQNPYSRTFVSRHHFCLVRLTADRATLTARTADGEVLDEREFIGRT